MSEDTKVVSLDGKPIEHPEITSERHFSRVDTARETMEKFKVIATAVVMIDDDGLLHVSFAYDSKDDLNRLIGGLEFTKWRLMRDDLDSVTKEKSRDD